MSVISRVAIKLLAVFSLLLVAACGGSSSDGAQPTSAPKPDYYSQDVSWTQCAESWLIDSEYQSLHMGRSQFECATVKVPASYDGESTLSDLSVGMIRIPASEESKGALFINPGGPGESGVEAAQWSNFPDELVAEYDIIGWDPRGVGVSSPIRCSDELDLASYYELPTVIDSAQELAQEEAFFDEYYADCKSSNPAWWAMTTANTVRDLDILRELVTPGDDLNFLGWSYGTTLAMEYIRLFPDNAGRLVLDSTTAPDLDEYEDDLTTASAIYESELRLFEKCAADSDCPGDSVEEVQDIIFAARDAAEAGQMYGSFGTVDGAGDFEEYTIGSASLIHHGIFALTYWPFEEAYPEFKAGMQELESGYMTIFEWYGLSLDGYDLSEGTRNNSYEILSIVNCLDKDTRDLHSESEYLAQQDKLAAANPFDEMYFDAPNGYEAPFEQGKGCDWTEFALADDSIPDPPSEIPAPVNESGKSFLVVSALGDTVTPYEYAQKTASDLNSVLLTYSGTGHALGFSGTSSCIDETITEYLLSGTLPDEGTVCD